MKTKGFTLLEALLALVVLMSLLLFLQPFLNSFMTMEEHLKESNYLEVQIGKIQMENEMEELEFEKIRHNKLVFSELQEKEKVEVIFEQYEKMIRKTTSKTGHQPIMTEVKKVNFLGDGDMIQMEVTTLEEKRYTYFFFPE
ncbi:MULTISPECIES: competence type IV pilus minor pilin ComGF [Vagococcus]|uniref:competence type IV pilus minor pilin ComGF n=1 Tax=Vagococcus TaxID=2737 RepID=UPI002FC9884A